MGPVKVKMNARGIWYTRLYLGTDPVTHKPIQKQRSFPEARSEDEALTMAIEYALSLAAYSAVRTSTRLVDALGHFIETNGYNWSSNTREAYRTCLKCWIRPHLSTIDLGDVRQDTIAGLYTMLDEKGSRGGNPLARSTTLLVHRLLERFFRWASDNGLVDKNPMASVDAPEQYPKVVETLSMGEVRELAGVLTAILHDDGSMITRRMTAAAAFLSLNTGMRRGEVLALAVNDLQGDEALVRATIAKKRQGDGSANLVRQERPKGKKPRKVKLSPQAVQVLNEHYRWRAGILSSSALTNSHLTVICNAHGSFLHPDLVSRVFKGIAAEAGLPQEVTFHTLRHTYASKLIEDGKSLKVVQAALGHADPATTLRIYAHLFPESTDGIESAFDDVFTPEKRPG